MASSVLPLVRRIRTATPLYESTHLVASRWVFRFWALHVERRSRYCLPSAAVVNQELTTELAGISPSERLLTHGIARPTVLAMTTKRWYGFIAAFDMSAGEVLLRYGTTTDPLKRLADLAKDAAFKPFDFRHVVVGERGAAAAFDRAITEHVSDMRTNGHWLRCSLENFTTLLAVIEGLAGSPAQLATVRFEVLASYNDRCAIAKTIKPVRGFVTPSYVASNISALDYLRQVRSAQGRADPSGIEQIRAILSDGRCLSVKRLATIIQPPVKVDSIRSMLSRNPDFSYIEDMGWVLTTAQQQERERKAEVLTEGARSVHSGLLGNSAH